MVAVRGKWHCRNTIVEVDQHYGFSEQEYRAQLGIICNSKSPPAETHAVQDLHGGLRERDEHYPCRPSRLALVHVRRRVTNDMFTLGI
jgi:hypothetical protein